MLSRLPLRLRVTLAFAVTTALALGVLAIFVNLRVTSSLEEQLRDSVHSELESLLMRPADDRAGIVRQTSGEVFMQIREGSRVSSSPQLRTRVSVPPGYSNHTVQLADDEGTEPEFSLVLVAHADGQVITIGSGREDSDAASASIRRQLLIGFPIALLVATALGYLVAGAGLRPIERMRTQAATISSRRSSERLPVPAARDELHRLGVTLNEMLDRLEAGLTRERRFVAEASHELRTPLALLRTELDLALAQPRTTAELEAALHSASEETERLIALASDLLSLASSDTAELPLERSSVDLGSLVSSVVGRFATVAEAGGRHISVSAPERTLIDADRARLDRALSNLVDNALRHGTGDVEVRVLRTPDDDVIDITDSGPGIPRDVLERATEPFAHGSATVGAGLGLAIVRAIVEAHGGTVILTNVERADSPSGRLGARVTVSLPR